MFYDLECAAWFLGFVSLEFVFWNFEFTTWDLQWNLEFIHLEFTLTIVHKISNK